MNKNELAKQIVTAIKAGWYEHSKPFSASTHDGILHWEKEIGKLTGWIEISKQLPEHKPNEATQVIVIGKSGIGRCAVYYNKVFYEIETWAAHGVHSHKIIGIVKWMYLPE